LNTTDARAGVQPASIICESRTLSSADQNIFNLVFISILLERKTCP
jgi:hypothetical protein